MNQLNMNDRGAAAAVGESRVKHFFAGLLAAAWMAGASAANLAPTVSMTAPVANANFVAPAAVTLAATATDSDGTIASVAFYRDTTLLGTVTRAPYSMNWTADVAGTYSVTSKATDNLGAVTTSAPLTVTVKANVLPSVALTAPAANASFVGPATISMAANATDTDGRITRVDYYRDTTLIGSATVAPYAFNWANVVAGTYSITAKATDDKWGVSTSAAVSVVVKANVAPTVNMTAPANASTVYVPGTVTLAANASDSDGWVAKVEFFNGATLIGADTTAPFSYSWSNAVAGSYSLTAKATDSKGATTTSAAIAVVVKAVPVPEVAITSPQANARFVAPAAFAVTASASIMGDTISKVEYISAGTLIGTATAAPYTINLTNVAAGSYNVSAKATGKLGGSATSAIVNLVVANNVGPQVSLDASQSGPAAPAVITLNATATDSDGTIAKVEFFNGATLLATVTQAPFAYTWNGVGAGTYSVTARATDDRNVASTSNTATVVVAAPDALDSTEVFYIHSDQINTAREIVNEAGVPVWESDPDPFGANLPNDNPAGKGPFSYNTRFPGQYFDIETGLHYNYYRDYDPQTGRYVQSDPIGLGGGVNTFGYVNGNPLLYMDPYGLFGWSDMPMLPQGLVDFSAGFGDSLTFGLTATARSAAGIEFVDKCSGYYSGGQLTDIAFEMATMGLSAGLKIASSRISADAARGLTRPYLSAYRRDINRIKGGFVHHINPLRGHIGGFSTVFPLDGLPASFNSGRWNLQWVPTSAAHSAAHRRLRRLENIWQASVNPVTTILRGMRDYDGACECNL